MVISGEERMFGGNFQVRRLDSGASYWFLCRLIAIHRRCTTESRDHHNGGDGGGARSRHNAARRGPPGGGASASCGVGRVGTWLLRRRTSESDVRAALESSRVRLRDADRRQQRHATFVERRKRRRTFVLPADTTRQEAAFTAREHRHRTRAPPRTQHRQHLPLVSVSV